MQDIKKKTFFSGSNQLQSTIPTHVQERLSINLTFNIKVLEYLFKDNGK